MRFLVECTRTHGNLRYFGDHWCLSWLEERSDWERHWWSPKYLKFPCVYVHSTGNLVTFLVGFPFLSIHWVIRTSVLSFPCNTENVLLISEENILVWARVSGFYTSILTIALSELSTPKLKLISWLDHYLYMKKFEMFHSFIMYVFNISHIPVIFLYGFI